MSVSGEALWPYSRIVLKNAPPARPAGFHQAAVASSATAVKAPDMPCALTPMSSGVWAQAVAGTSTRPTKATKDAKKSEDTTDQAGGRMPPTLPFVSSGTLLCFATRAQEQ